MKKLRNRLTMLFIVLIGISMLVTGIFVARIIKNSYNESIRKSLVDNCKMIEATVDMNRQGSRPEKISFFTQEAKRLFEISDARVTFIDDQGNVLGDSHHDAASMENHLSRQEIMRAKEEGSGSSHRDSSTISEKMYYVAVKVDGGYIRLALGLEEVEDTIQQFWFILITGLLILMVLASLISFRVARSVTRPLEKITRVAGQITHMNYKARVKIANKDEIGQLGEAINAMADSLQFQLIRIQEEEGRLKSVLENMISGVVMVDKEGQIVLMNRFAEDILGFSAKELLGKKFDQAKQQLDFTQIIREGLEKRERIREELTFYFPSERILEINVVPMEHGVEDWHGILIVLHDISAVRRLERMRSEFVANVSHELKTPVAAVKGFAETLLAGAVNDPETAKTFLQIIYDESERLNRLIGDILELSKIESKRIPMHFSPIHLQSFVEKVLEVMGTVAEKKNISLEMQVDETIYLEADEDRLRQILLNLISNGIAYTPEGGRVRVKAELNEEPGEERVKIMITDTGIGIPKKDLPRIFERFYRVDKARSRSSGGTGLGLSIVKHLVDLHKGTICVESSLGVGTKFTIELPVIH